MLHIEEILLRHDIKKRNILLFNSLERDTKAIVLGVSGKVEK